ncbi:haloacid dehalogenase-like hydrolase [Desulfosporosinus nitroreducens]|uniref:haloacid dehalogenase-like hydrolase n=1 Tax=Desulfosporosinus nitroreducens TaxID=2018668 RepID=UPI002852A408|nr:haloacid dehalogenase-like hydrolase [Desulfosporosinus nitroreducens]
MNVYDFDKTIYGGDSTLDFYVYCLKKYPRTACYLPSQIGSALLYGLGVHSKVRFKEIFYSFLRSLQNVDEVIDGFWESHERKIKGWYLKQRHNSDLIISASPEFLLKPIGERLSITILASKVNKTSGLYEGENCYGQNKVERLNREIKDWVIDEFYSDSLSDAPLAMLAKQSFRVDGDDLIPWPDYHPSGFKKAKGLLTTKEFIGFLVIGTINTLNGVLFAYLFSLLFNVNTAFMVGYLMSLSLSYLLNSCLTFKEAVSWPKYFKFCFSYIPNFLIQNFIVLIFFNVCGLPELLVYSLAAIIGVPITFILIKNLAFRSVT